MLEKGFPQTVKQLLLRPGDTIKTFIRSRRNGLTKPITFVFLASLIYTVIDYFFPFQAKYMSHEGEVQNYMTAIARWITENYGYSNLIMSIFIAAWIKIFFRKHSYTIFEIGVLLCYVMGMGMLFLGFFGFFEHTLNITLVVVGTLISFGYAVWAIGQFFRNKWSNYLKAALAYFLGSLSFTITFIVIGIVLEIVFGGK